MMGEQPGAKNANNTPMLFHTPLDTTNTRAEAEEEDARGLDCPICLEPLVPSPPSSPQPPLLHSGGKSDPTADNVRVAAASRDVLRVLACGHTFHQQCLAEWLATQRGQLLDGRCPCCNLLLVPKKTQPLQSSGGTCPAPQVHVQVVQLSNRRLPRGHHSENSAASTAHSSSRFAAVPLPCVLYLPAMALCVYFLVQLVKIMIRWQIQ